MISTEQFFSLDRPLHTVPEKSQVKTANLRGLPQLVTRLGGKPWEILEFHGVDPQTFSSTESYVDCKTLNDILESCAHRFNDPLFGIHLGQLQDADVYGFVTALCRSAPNLREAINGLIEFIPVLHCPESVLELVEGSEVAEFRWSERSDMGINDQANFQSLLVNLEVLRMLGGTRFSPSYVSLPIKMFRNAAPDIQNAIGCEVRLTNGLGCIAFPKRALDTRVSSANPPLYQLLNGYLVRLKSSSNPVFLDRVTGYVGERLGSGDVSVESCADFLGISVRTLQLRLRRYGVSYSDILEHIRLARARYVLAKTDIPVAEISDLLGYSERTSFGRAFKRWTGFSPREYRENAGAVTGMAAR